MSTINRGSARIAATLVRLASTSDADQISLCLAAAFEPFRSSYTPAAFADTVLTSSQLRQRMAHMTIYVAINPGQEVLGTVGCSIEGHTGHLRGMAVLPGAQGSGIAERLLKVVESDLIAANCARLTLDTTLPLQRAIGFYKRHGFTPSGRIEDFFGMPLHEYEKRLLGAEP